MYQDPIEQARAFNAFAFHNPGEFPPVVDVETERNVSVPADAVERVWNAVQEVEAGTGKVPMIYTSVYMWARLGSPDPKWAKYPLWLADPNHAVNPPVPAPWTTWEFWQTGTKADANWFGIRTTSNLLDHDQWNGVHWDLVAKYAPQWLPKPPAEEPPAPPTLEQRVARLEEQAKAHGWTI